MASIYIQQNSPYYWLRYYDPFEQDPTRKRKSVNTKIEVSKADLNRYLNNERIKGNDEVRKKKSAFEQGLNDKTIFLKTGIKIKYKLKLSEGLEKFISERSVPGSKNQLKLKSILSYRSAVGHFINAATDKYIHQYTKKQDYFDLLRYFEEKQFNQHSRAIYSRTLSALWNYFIKEDLANHNIIEKLIAPEKEPSPIELDDIVTLVSYFKDKKENPHHYHFIYFLLLTGCRPSSAMVQLKEDIDFKNRIIKIKNVKAPKNKQFYSFPIYKELGNLIFNEMQIKEGDTGRLFDMFRIGKENYTESLKFWTRANNMLYNAKCIKKKYVLKQIRSTFASFLINYYQIDIYTVKKLLDHSDIKVTDKHYISFKLGSARTDLNTFNLDTIYLRDLGLDEF